jgi:hypothetical protein
MYNRPEIASINYQHLDEFYSDRLLIIHNLNPLQGPRIPF